MNSLKTLAGFVLAAAVAMPAIALAQGHDEHHDDQHDDRRTEQGHEQGHDNHPAPAHDEHARGARPAHSWHKGDRVPASYRNKRYEVTDWKSHNLRQPPSGYHWVNVNGDFVLAAVATGVIADLLLNN
jgi:Ni/Co efflux regulator RcnB